MTYKLEDWSLGDFAYVTPVDDLINQEFNKGRQLRMLTEAYHPRLERRHKRWVGPMGWIDAEPRTIPVIDKIEPAFVVTADEYNLVGIERRRATGDEPDPCPITAHFAPIAIGDRVRLISTAGQSRDHARPVGSTGEVVDLTVHGPEARLPNLLTVRWDSDGDTLALFETRFERIARVTQ